MIQPFPLFEKLSIHHKSEIETLVSRFPPYSDFNFTSLWTYNTEDAIQISLLHNNLVVQFTDYITSKPFLSFIGTNNVLETTHALMQFSQEKNFDVVLKLIPEIVVTSETALSDNFIIMEDKDNHDYIVSTDEIVELPHHKYRTKKNLIVQFKKLYPNHAVRSLDLKDTNTNTQILHLFSLWEKKSGKSPTDTNNELVAIKRLLSNTHHFEVFALGIFDKEALIGFTLFESTHQNHGIYSFQKADREYRGIFTYMCHEVAKIMKEKGCVYLNYEQDLGIEGLRKAKSLWKPTHFLKKYIITPKKAV